MKRLLKDMAIYGAGDFVFKFVAFAVFPFYTHVFTVEQFGVMALVITIMGLLSGVMGLGVNNAVQRFYHAPETGEASRPALVSGGLAALVVWAVSVALLALAALWPARELLLARFGIPWQLLVFAVLTNVPTLVVTFCLDVLRLHFSPWRFTLLSALRSLLGVAVGFYMIVGLGWGLDGYFLGLLTGAALAVPVALWVIRRDLTVALSLDWAGQIVRFGYPFIFAGLAYWVTGSMDRWMLGELSDTTEVGLYSVAYRFAALLTFLITAFGQAWSPLVIKLTADDPGYRATIGKLFSQFLFGLTFAGLGLGLFGQELLRLTTPAAYWPAATTLAVLAMGLVLLGSTQITVIGISLEKRTHLLAVAAWITAVANLVLNALLIPRFGALGAAMATLLAYGLMTGLYLFWTQRLHRLALEPAKLAVSFALIPVSLLAAWWLNGLAFGVTAVVAKFSFCGLVLALGFAARILAVSDLHALTRRKLS